MGLGLGPGYWAQSLPGVDAAGHVEDVGVAVLTEEGADLRGAYAALAVDDDWLGAGDLIETARNFAKGDEEGLRDVAGLVLIDLADVEEEEVVSLLELGFHFRGQDLRGHSCTEMKEGRDW